MSSLSVSDVKRTLEELSGLDFSSFEPRMIENAEEKLRRDVAKLQSNPLLKNGVEVRGAMYDVDTGKVFRVNGTEVLSADGSKKVQSDVAGSGLAHSGGVLSLNIDSLGALGSASVAQADNLLVSDNGTEKKITFSNLEDTIFSNVDGDATIAAGGATDGTAGVHGGIHCRHLPTMLVVGGLNTKPKNCCLYPSGANLFRHCIQSHVSQLSQFLHFSSQWGLHAHLWHLPFFIIVP